MANFLLCGDAPNTNSGLARIARDICKHLVMDGHQVDFLGLGWEWAWTDDTTFSYPVWPVRDGKEFAQRDVLEHVHRLTKDAPDCGHTPDERPCGCEKKLILWFIWDSSRCASSIMAIRHEQQKGRFKNVEIWGYYAVDAEGPGPGGAYTGPAAVAVDETDRILAYTEFGARVLKATRTKPGFKIDNLPHGLSAPFIDYDIHKYGGLMALDDKNIRRWAELHYGKILGAVATNQPRKDLPLLLEAGAIARDAGAIDALWLHTDKLFGNYSLPLFCEAFGWIGGKNLLITTPYQRDPEGLSSKWKLNTDEELAAMYQACGVTFAPGLGEGWGYPIVESQALGVQCVVLAYAGGSELVPDPMCRVWIDQYRWDGGYCLKRPVAQAQVVADHLKSAASTAEENRDKTRALGQRWAWTKIWPELWRPWIEEGLK